MFYVYILYADKFDKFYIEKQTRKEAMELEIKLKNLSKDRIHKFIEKYQHK